MLLLSSSHGFKFNVGGRDGWVLNPSENFNHWAERNRFQFKKGNDSVLLVTRENYNQCNTKNPLKSIKEEGESEFKFERSGPHYFISGDEDHCKKGQKLIIVVLAIRHTKSTSSPPAPAPLISSPSASPTPSAPASDAPGPSPSSADAPAKSTKNDKSYALGVTTMTPSVAMSVAIVVAMFLGCFGWR
ncbi:Early nodulin-like protein 1, partial [Bienertia sinuspersici]